MDYRMLATTLLLANLVANNLTPNFAFEPSREYFCFAGPHVFALQINRSGRINVSRYLLTSEKYLSMPSYQTTGELQWHTLSKDDKPLSLLRLHTDTMELNIAWLDQHGSLVRSDRHPTDCHQS